MDHVLLARLALSSLCVIQAMATVMIDFGRTHATNPLWPGHARFHVVWQSSTVVLLSAVELILIWLTAPLPDGRFYFAAVLAALSPVAFLIAFLSRKVFGTTLSDLNGISPAQVTIFGVVRSIDMNLTAVVVALFSLWAIIAIYRA